MSFAVDANILLYASDESSPRHARARECLAQWAAGSEIICFTWSTLFTYLRVATHPRIFEQPLSPDTAKANIEALLALPHVRVLSEDDGFWRHFTDVTRSIPVRGNLVPDAHLVALLRQHGVRVLYTNDTDFKKFAAIEARNPFGRDDGA